MRLRGWIILLIEDEPLIAMDVTDTLEGVGATVRGPIRSLEEAHRILGDCLGLTDIDAIVLDYRLIDGRSDKLAQRLADANVPFLLHTGSSEIVKPLASALGVSILSKPSSEAEMIEAVAALQG